MPDHLLDYIAGQLEIDPTNTCSTRKLVLKHGENTFVPSVKPSVFASSPHHPPPASRNSFCAGFNHQPESDISRLCSRTDAALANCVSAFSTIEDLYGEIQHQADDSVYHQLTHSVSAQQQHQVFLTLEKRRTPELTYLQVLPEPAIGVPAFHLTTLMLISYWRILSVGLAAFLSR